MLGWAGARQPGSVGLVEGWALEEGATGGEGFGKYCEGRREGLWCWEVGVGWGEDLVEEVDGLGEVRVDSVEGGDMNRVRG